MLLGYAVCVLYANPEKVFKHPFCVCKELHEVNKTICKEVDLISNTVESFFWSLFQDAYNWMLSIFTFHALSALLHFSVSFS